MGNIWRRYPRRGLRRLPALEGLLLAPGVRVDPSDFARLSSAFLDEAGPCAFFRAVPLRSEEHTSELLSLMRISYPVFCLHKILFLPLFFFFSLFFLSFFF